VSPAEVQTVVVGLLRGLLSSSVFLLVVFLGFCVLFNFTKLRAINKNSQTVRSLDDRLSGGRYLSPDVPRGPADQLKTPELLEQSGRQVS